MSDNIKAIAKIFHICGDCCDILAELYKDYNFTST